MKRRIVLSSVGALGVLALMPGCASDRGPSSPGTSSGPPATEWATDVERPAMTETYSTDQAVALPDGAENRQVVKGDLPVLKVVRLGTPEYRKANREDGPVITLDGPPTAEQWHWLTFKASGPTRTADCGDIYVKVDVEANELLSDSSHWFTSPIRTELVWSLVVDSSVINNRVHWTYRAVRKSTKPCSLPAGRLRIETITGFAGEVEGASTAPTGG